MANHVYCPECGEETTMGMIKAGKHQCDPRVLEALRIAKEADEEVRRREGLPHGRTD